MTSKYSIVAETPQPAAQQEGDPSRPSLDGDEDFAWPTSVDLDRAAGCLLGLAVGDALGTTLEFTTRDAGPVITGLVGGGPFRLKPGQWTDDTSMALCLAESLVGTLGHFDPPDLMARFGRWYREGENSVTGRCFDIGNITRAALEHFARTGETAATRSPDPQEAGNGTLMRLAPVAIMAAPDIELAATLADAQSRTTHRAELAHEACRLFATMLVEAMTGGSKEEVLRPRMAEGVLGPVAAGAWREKTREEISSSGYVLATLEASLWCVGRTESFADAVLLAANLGDDADTVAAVTGQLAGALYGRTAIPPGWLDQLSWRDRIEGLAGDLVRVGARWRSARERFTWSDGDVVMRDGDGNVITPRQAKEGQLERLRSEVEEDLPADTSDPAAPVEVVTIAAPAGRAPVPKLSAETLLGLGFVDVASWGVSGERIAYALDGPHAPVNGLRLDEPNALYAFVQGEQVLYIGKTARTIRKRFTGYCRPDRGQRTNWRCRGKIREILAGGGEVRIFVFNPISQLRYGAFELNLAAGLEDALIAEFDPPWNGRERGQPISEEAEREKAEEVAPAEAAGPEPAEVAQPGTALATFEIKLGQAYYEQGIVNPGAEASRFLGQHGEPVRVTFDDGSEPLVSFINRTANRTGSVRLVGRNRQIAQWFQAHFAKGDVVQAMVLDPHHILLLSTPAPAIPEEEPPMPTTVSPPLRIAEVELASGGCLGITFAPGKKQRSAFSGSHHRDLATDLDAIKRWNAAAIVTLVEEAELKALQIENLGAEVRARGMDWVHLPIPDVTAPDAAFDLAWPDHSAQLRALLTSGAKVLVHCKGGLGRAGTIAARLLVELGSNPADAIAAVRAVRPGAIEVGAQERWIALGQTAN